VAVAADVANIVEGEGARRRVVVFGTEGDGHAAAGLVAVLTNVWVRTMVREPLTPRLPSRMYWRKGWCHFLFCV